MKRVAKVLNAFLLDAAAASAAATAASAAAAAASVVSAAASELCSQLVPTLVAFCLLLRSSIYACAFFGCILFYDQEFCSQLVPNLVAF